MGNTGSNAAGPAPTKLFIGIGNEYRGDDGVGPFLARKIGRLNLAGVAVTEAGGEGTDLMAVWQDPGLVVVADAVYSGGKPGMIFRFEVPGEALPKALFSRHSTHAFGLFEAVELSKTLGTLPKRLVIYGIEGSSFDAGVGLSPEVEQAAGEVELRIVEEFG